MPLQPTSICPILVERDTEKAEFDALLAGAKAGAFRLVLIDGPAGVGKSRLVRDVAQMAASQGFGLLSGACAERDLDFPFAPFVDAIRQHVSTSGDDPAAFLGPQQALLAEILPEHGQLRPVQGTGVTPSPEHGKRQIFEGLLALLGRLASERPLCVVLEDVHWCDPTSLELLELMPRRLRSSRLLVLLTGRGEEARAELRHCLDTLHRSRALTHLTLAPLSRDGVAAMLGAMLPAPPPSPLVATVSVRTGGNPFLIEETVASIRTTGSWLSDEPVIPFGIRELVNRQVRDLDATAVQVLNLAAVAGERVDFDFLHSMSGLAPDAFLGIIRSLIDAGLLVEQRGPYPMAFRHALVRDAVRERLLIPERQRLHHRIATALEEAQGIHAHPVADGELGYHFHRAGAWEKALLHASGAGESALAVQANAEAYAHFRRALDAAIALDHPSQARMHCRCGQALSVLGEIGPAREHLESALRIIQTVPDVDTELDATDALAALLASKDYATAQQLAERALAAARTHQDRQREGRALNRLGNILTNLAQFSQGRALHEQALLIAEERRDLWGVADALDYIGMSHYLSGEMPEARAMTGRAAGIFLASGDLERAASALTTRGHLVVVLDGACPTDAAAGEGRSDVMQGLELCQRIGWRAGEAYAHTSLATIDLAEARFGDAAHHLNTALAIAQEMDHLQWQVIARLIYGFLHVAILDHARALQQFDLGLDLARQVGSRQWIERLEAWRTYSRVRSGMSLAGAEPEPPTSLPAGVHHRRTLLAQAASDLREGRADRALRITEWLHDWVGAYQAPEVLLARGEALAALGCVDDADAACLEARRWAELAGPRFLLWKVAASRARLWSGLDETISAEEATRARAEIDLIASRIPDPAWRETFLTADDLKPWMASSGRRRTRRTSDPGGLTNREQAVAWCVARGMSNKEIASALSISVKTVEMHIGSCLGKLAYTSRAQLAVWAVEQGLAPPPELARDTGLPT